MTDKEVAAQAIDSLEQTAKALNALGITIMLEHGMLAVQRLDELASKVRAEANELKSHLS